MKIVFFDGDCAFCNRMLLFILRFEKAHDLRFAPLQGESAKDFLPKALRENVNSLVFYEQEKSFSAAKAAFRIAYYLRFPFSLFFLLQPLAFAFNPLYYLLARFRHNLGGQCRLLTAEEKSRFLA